MNKTIKSLFVSVIATFMLLGCSSEKDTTSQLTGTWYQEGSQDIAFTLYNDGTCEIAYEYGTGTWAIVNTNQLKLTNFYGEIQTANIISIEDGCLILGSAENSKTVTYLDKPYAEFSNKSLDKQKFEAQQPEYPLTDFLITGGFNNIASVEWKDSTGNHCRGLMNANGEVFFKFPNEYPFDKWLDLRETSDGYLYNQDVIIAPDGMPIYTCPKSEGYTIAAYGNEVIMIKQHISNMTENVIKIGFMDIDGNWISEPYIETDGTGYSRYVGEGYFADIVDEKTYLFINPMTQDQFTVDNIAHIVGFYDGIVVTESNNTVFSPKYGINILDGSTWEYQLSGDILSVSEGYIICGDYDGAYGGKYEDVIIYDMHGNQVCDLSQYELPSDITPVFYNDLAIILIRGADDHKYITALSAETMEFAFEPIKINKVETNGWRTVSCKYKDNILVELSNNEYTSNSAHILNATTGKLTELDGKEFDEPLASYGTLFFMDDCYYNWDGKQIIPHATFIK